LIYVSSASNYYLNMEWYYNKQDDLIEGPISERKLIELFRSEEIDEDTLIWEKQMEDWKPLKRVENISIKTTPKPPPLPKKNRSVDFNNQDSKSKDDGKYKMSPIELAEKDLQEVKNKNEENDGREYSLKWFSFYLYILIPIALLNVIVDTYFSSRTIPTTEENIETVVGTGVIIILGLIFYGLYTKKRWGWNLNIVYLLLVSISSPFLFTSNLEELFLYFILSLTFLALNWVYFHKRKELFNK